MLPPLQLAELLVEKLNARQFGNFAVPEAANEKLAIVPLTGAAAVTARTCCGVSATSSSPHSLPGAHALVLRGREERIALAEWLLPRLEHRPRFARRTAHHLRRSRPHEEVRLFFPAAKCPDRGNPAGARGHRPTRRWCLSQRSPEASRHARASPPVWLSASGCFNGSTACARGPPNDGSPCTGSDGVDDNLVRIFFVPGREIGGRSGRSGRLPFTRRATWFVADCAPAAQAIVSARKCGVDRDSRAGGQGRCCAGIRGGVGEGQRQGCHAQRDHFVRTGSIPKTRRCAVTLPVRTAWRLSGQLARLAGHRTVRHRGESVIDDLRTAAQGDAAVSP